MATPTYRDLDFNLTYFPQNGALSLRTNERDIIQSVKNIVLSSNGEVPFTTNRVGVWDKKFSTLAPIERDLLISNIKRTINYIDPRVKVSDVQVAVVNTRLQITINSTIFTNPPISKDIILILNQL